MSHNHCHHKQEDSHSHSDDKSSFDWLLWGSLLICTTAYILHLSGVFSDIASIERFSHAVFDLFNRMWWGVALGIVFVGILDHIPKEMIISFLGKSNGVKGILKATLAGVALDLCSHGILLVGMKLYERGASLGQTMAFLIASPWNSFSLTLILVALIGLSWTLAFIALSIVLAIISGLIFDKLVSKNVLPENPHSSEIPEDYKLSEELKKIFTSTSFNFSFVKSVFYGGLKDASMVLRWVFFGVVIAAILRGVMDESLFQDWFGPTVAGLALTLIAATIIEVCSEGSTPIAADIMTRAHAPGNAFTFLMAGVSTDYTEIMSLKERTKSWKIALFLPLVTLPQVLLIGIILNQL